MASFAIFEFDDDEAEEYYDEPQVAALPVPDAGQAPEPGVAVQAVAGAAGGGAVQEVGCSLRPAELFFWHDRRTFFARYLPCFGGATTQTPRFTPRNPGVATVPRGAPQPTERAA